MKRKVYLVKFNSGYYAKKQPHYNWSFTDKKEEALQYKTLKAAEERADWGLRLASTDVRQATAEIEVYEIEEVWNLIENENS